MSDRALVAGFRTRLQEGQKAIRERYFTAGDAVQMLRSRSQLIDQLLGELWAQHDMPADAALAAVGGYGRGELFPASDIDLLILLPGVPDDALTAKLEALIGRFWDIGLEIGHSVRTVDECLVEAAGDITIQTALIEARRLTGDESLFARFASGLRAQLDPQAFFKAKRIEQDERYLRFQDTPYSLEPNLKESPGGLRDLQIILWVAQAAGYGRSWEELRSAGFVTDEEYEHLVRCESSLQRLRIRLHYQLNRREDRLLFDYQTSLAEQLAYQPVAAKRASEEIGRAHV